MLENDKNEGFRAALDLSKGRDYLHSLENGKLKSSDPGPYTKRISAEAVQRQSLVR